MRSAHATLRRAAASSVTFLALLLAAAPSCDDGPRAARPPAPARSGPVAAVPSVEPLGKGFEPLRARFDADAAGPRLLVLASPT